MLTPRPEHQILLCIACSQPGANEKARLKQLFNSNIDWEYLLTTAKRHGVLPLLHKHANNVLGDHLPGRFRSTLKRESVENAQSVLFLVSKSLQVQKILNEHRIENALFKGALLAELAYGEIGLRQAGDIDVLIHPEDFTQAKHLLESLGYQMYPRLTDAQLKSHLAFHCEIQFVRDDWFTVVDLHWNLTPRTFVFGLSGEKVLSRLRTVPFAGAQAQTFSTEDLILYQAMHGAKHLWYRLEWLASLAELVRSQPASNWSQVVESTIRARATRILGLALHLVETLYQIEIPEEVLRALDHGGEMKNLARQIGADMFGRKLVAESTDTSLFNLRIMDRKRDALVSMLRAIFVPTISDWAALSLPGALHPLYYAFRPMRLTKAYSAAALRRLINS